MVPIILIIAAIAIPYLLQSCMAANEASAVANLRTIKNAPLIYDQTYAYGYPSKLGALGGVVSTSPRCNQEEIVDSSLPTAPNPKSGCTFTYAGEQCVVTVLAGHAGRTASTAPSLKQCPSIIPLGASDALARPSPGWATLKGQRANILSG